MIYKLMPTDVPSENWECSTYKDAVIVRAASEDAARTAADLAFHKATPKSLGRDTPLSPWIDRELVSCRRVDDSDYKGWGPTEVLFPEGY